MNPYFKPLRRKVGFVVLLLACVVMAAWFRGLETQDSIWFGLGPQRTYLSSGSIITVGRTLVVLSSSAPDGFVWSRQECEGDLHWISRWVTVPTAEKGEFLDPLEPPDGPLNPDWADYHWKFLGCEIGRYRESATYRATFSFLKISYLSVSIPLIIVASWLILRTPQRSSQRSKLNLRQSALA